MDGGVVHPGIDTLHLRILGHMLHDPLVLLFNHRGTLGLATHRILDDRLTFEFFRPTRQLMVHRDVVRRRLARLGGILSGCERNSEEHYRRYRAEHAGKHATPWLVYGHGTASLKIVGRIADKLLMRKFQDKDVIRHHSHLCDDLSGMVIFNSQVKILNFYIGCQPS